MILTDIYIPAVDGNYDFMLDENVPVSQIMEEICGMISKKVKEDVPEDISAFALYSLDAKLPLDWGKSLHANGIKDGSRLLFI